MFEGKKTKAGLALTVGTFILMKVNAYFELGIPPDIIQSVLVLALGLVGYGVEDKGQRMLEATKAAAQAAPVGKTTRTIPARAR